MTAITSFKGGNMPWPRKHRPRKGRRKIGSAKRAARRKNAKKTT